MGEARRRGSAEQRVREAISRNKAELYRQMGFNANDPEFVALRTALDAFLAHLKPGEWEARKAAIADRLSAHPRSSLADARSVRDEVDEIAWYLLLVELALTDPLCQETNQAARTLPFIGAIGALWHVRHRIAGLDEKIKAALTDYRKSPDGILFEIMVALNYAAKGWNVEMLDAAPPAKTPDLLVRRGTSEYYVECKRQSRRPTYTDRERQAFLKMWEGVPRLVRETGQWIWLDMVFHEEIERLPRNFLTTVLAQALPIGAGDQVLIDDAQATIRARHIGRRAVLRHMEENRVKQSSSMLRSLLGGDWAPRNSDGPMAIEARHSSVPGCEGPPSNRWVEEIAWAMGGTRSCDSPKAIAAKARDVKRLLVDALRQLPLDKPSIIHVAIETHEGRTVDRLRDQRIRHLLDTFSVDRPIAAVFVHSIQCNEVIDKAWEVDETVQSWYWPLGEIPNLPGSVLIPSNIPTIRGAHWEIYQ